MVRRCVLCAVFFWCAVFSSRRLMEYDRPPCQETPVPLPSRSERWFRSPFLVFFLLALPALLIYSNTFESAFHFDDFYSIVNNPSLKSPLHAGAIWSFWPTRFVTYLTLAANHALGQDRVFGYHVFNLIVHLVSSLLVWWFFLLTFSTPALRNDAIVSRAGLLSFFAALVFETHPVQTQAVTYIIQRATSLAALFYLTALCLFIRARLLEEKEKRGAGFFYAGSLAAVLCAMFTKETTITLPLMILLYEFCFFGTPKGIPWKRVAVFLVPLVVIPVTMVLSRSVDFVQMRRTAEGVMPFSPLEYLPTQFRVLITYVRLLFLPLRQNLDYDYPLARGLMEPAILASLLALAAIFAAALKSFRRYRIISFGVFWFFLTLAPESSLVPIRDLIFEHRLYLPMAGFSLLLVGGLYYLFRGRHTGRWIAVLLVLVSGYGMLSYRRNFVWKDNFSLWNDIIAKSPQKARAYNDRGDAYAMRGDVKRALADYDKVIAIGLEKGADEKDTSSPAFRRTGQTRLALTAAYYNRAIVYHRLKYFNRAISDLSKALDLDPRLPMAHYRRGLLYAATGNGERALADFAGEIENNPSFAPAYVERAKIYFQKKEYEKSIRDMAWAHKVGYRVAPDFK